MRRDEYGELSAFVAVADERSFTRAAARLGVTPSALSHAIRGFEERLGLRLFTRTTRSVALTDAGERLLERVRPALGEIEGAFADLAQLRSRPAGRVRIRSSRVAALMYVAPMLGRFLRRNPDVTLEILVDDSTTDPIGEGFDAGIHLGEFVASGMRGVKISGEQRTAVVGSPAYFQSRPKPKTPRDLQDHACINVRLGGRGHEIYRWEFEKGRKELTVAVNGPLVVDDPDLVVRAALDGVGLAYFLEERVVAQLASGRLVRVLEDWCAPYPGFFLYFPTRRQMSPALSAFIEAVRIE